MAQLTSWLRGLRPLREAAPPPAANGAMLTLSVASTEDGAEGPVIDEEPSASELMALGRAVFAERLRQLRPE